MMIYGNQDRSHRKTDFTSIRRYSDRIQVQMISDAGHFPELENPFEYARLLNDFLITQENADRS